MTKNFKFFLITIGLSLSFFWGVNVLGEDLENFFYWREMAENPKLLAAQTNQQIFEQNIRSLKSIRDKEIEDFKTEDRAAISIFVNNQGIEKILFAKDTKQRLPIASLTKLMTAFVVLEHYDLAKEIKVSQEAVDQEENFGKLEAGKFFPVEYLLYPLLMESSNDAAFSLANDYDGMTEAKFVELMNLEAQKLGLQNTHFVNSSGLDPDELDEEPINYSTAVDLAKLAKELLKNPLIWEILSTPKFDLYGPELINTNKLLGVRPGVIGGKTGYTDEALGCFLLVSRAPKSKGYLINVILGSGDRFGEMEKLLEWVKKAYKW